MLRSALALRETKPPEVHLHLEASGLELSSLRTVLNILPVTPAEKLACDDKFGLPMRQA